MISLTLGLFLKASRFEYFTYLHMIFVLFSDWERRKRRESDSSNRDPSYIRL